MKEILEKAWAGFRRDVLRELSDTDALNLRLLFYSGIMGASAAINLTLDESSIAYDSDIEYILKEGYTQSECIVEEGFINIDSTH